MKRLLYIIIVTIGISSCAKNVLDKVPLDIISDAVVWNDPILMDAYLAETWADTYVLVNEVNGNGINNGKGWFQITWPNKIGGESKVNWGGNINAFRNGNLNIGGGLFEWWEQSYQIIRNLNEFLEKVETSPADREFKDSRSAEARFLRAYNYFAMVKRYGGVPIIIKAQGINDPEDELFLPRNKEEEVYDFIIAEMDAILADLPQTKQTVRYGKPTKYAALALECRAALYAASIAKFGTVQLEGLVGIDAAKADGYYQKAYEAAQAIIKSDQFRLYNDDADRVTNFRNLFLKKNNSEVILSVIHDEVNSQQGGNGWAWDFIETPLPNGVGAGNADGVYLEIVEAFEYIDGRPGTLDREAITEDLWTIEELWEGKDPRFFASIYTQNTPWKGSSLEMHNGIITPDGNLVPTGSFNGVLAIGRHQQPSGTGFGILKRLDEVHDNTIGWGTSNTDYQVFRYGEILLNLAESGVEIGKTDSALWAVNQIRERAGILPLVAVDRGKVRQERKVELLFENHRYWDLRRWRTAVTELSKNGSGLRYMLDYATGKFKLQIQQNVDGTVAVPTFHIRNYYLPINPTRTANNTKLVENPHYQ